MTMRAAPMASGAMTPAPAPIPVQPIVRTRKNVPLPRLRSEVAEVLGRRVEEADTQKASWPLLRAGDTGDTVLAAQYLLRDAGVRTAVDGRYTPATVAAVTEFQQATGAEEPNGILGGESWPVLARTVDRAA